MSYKLAPHDFTQRLYFHMPYTVIFASQLSSPPMAPQVASIQSFFQPEVPSAQKTQKPAAPHQPSDPGDGFTSSEIEAALHPTLHQWQPRATYNDTNIGALVAGPGYVALMGRIVNFHNTTTPSNKPKAAQGCFRLTVKDDTGAFTVSTLLSINLSDNRFQTRTGEALVRKS